MPGMADQQRRPHGRSLQQRLLAHANSPRRLLTSSRSTGDPWAFQGSTEAISDSSTDRQQVAGRRHTVPPPTAAPERRRLAAVSGTVPAQCLISICRSLSLKPFWSLGSSGSIGSIRS